MNTKLSSVAIALSLIAGSALAAGADGATFPSLDLAGASTLTRAQVRAEAVQLQDAQRGSFASADGSIDTADARPAALRSRDAVKAEVLDAIRVGSIGHATTPY